MDYRELLSKDSFWMQEQSDIPIVLSTRIRLARNLADCPFPQAMGTEMAEKIEKRIANVLKDLDVDGQKVIYIPLNELTVTDKKVLIEKHLISPNFAESNQARGLALANNHKVSVMVNEEDHLRIQVLMPGNKLEEALSLAGDIDDYLESKLDIAYKEKFGYLTSCPTNVGTGLRVSVMTHLPALVLTNQIQRVLGAFGSLGLVARGLYGEGSKAFGNIFQISNQVTLGKSEDDTLSHLQAVTSQLAERELHAREMLRQEVLLNTEDRVWRARGILQNARLLTSEETFSLLSDDRLGIDMDILPRVDAGFISLLVNSLQGCLQLKTNKLLDGNLVNLERANLLRQFYQDKTSPC
ncbi:MAG: ATP--guanido phosphotransferase [Gracilibacter sp. BRH_c7a]|nr:MAG: ATP--guanido phosphotransferase [Gracilibacter sp. BRH_c7a]